MYPRARTRSGSERLFSAVAGEITATVRPGSSWYPRDVWRYVLSCQWSRIAEEEAFPGRCAEAGDELGSVVVTARLARDLMRLWLLMQRRYPPYSKWLGSAFARAPGGAGLGRHLAAALAADGWGARERELGLAYRIAAEAHNRLGLTEPLDPGTRPYFSRPAPRIRSSTARRPSANSVTPGPLPRYLVSDRDMSVLGVGDTQT